MKYITIDVESTGIDPETSQILEIGIVLEDTNNIKPVQELPQFKCIVAHPTYSGSAFAISINMRIFKILAEYESIKDVFKKQDFAKANNILIPSQVATSIAHWMKEHDSEIFNSPVNVAGKNYAVFDKLFLDKVPGWEKIKFERRYLDPAILFVDWLKDLRLPGLGECMQRARIETQVTHDALQDAIDTLLCFRAKYNEK